ncbi:MAG: hypothetical protein AAF604_15445 [Acidobacteriota bacterium]
MRRSARNLVLLVLIVCMASLGLSLYGAPELEARTPSSRLALFWSNLLESFGAGSSSTPEETTGNGEPTHEGDDGGGQMDPGGGVAAR